MKKENVFLSSGQLDREYESTQEGKSKLAILQRTLEEAAKSLPQRAIEIPNETEYVRFLVYSDTHLGSMYERADVIKSVYKCANERNIKYILHCGDLLDGHRIYKGQEFELHSHGYDRQKKHALKIYKDIKTKAKTFFITGNHDASLEKLAGINVGEEWAKELPWGYVGKDIGRVSFDTPNGKLNVDMMHPDGGTSYALSYRSQKICEQLEGGKKPNILLIGHFHKAEAIPHYRNICVIQAGCCQAQTPFMKRKPSAAHVGFWIVEAHVGKHANSFKTEFFAFY